VFLVIILISVTSTLRNQNTLDVNLINIYAHVGFAVDKVARGQAYFPVLRFFSCRCHFSVP